MSNETRANILTYLDSIHPESASVEAIQGKLQIDASEFNKTLEKMNNDDEIVVENSGKIRISERLAGQFELKNRYIRNPPKKIKLTGQDLAEWKKGALFVLGLLCVLGLIFLGYKFPELTRILVFSSGLIFSAIVIVIALIVPNPTRFQFFIFRTILAVFIAAVASLLPGFLAVKWGAFVEAGGSMAVFIAIYFWNPAKYALNDS